MVRAMTLIATEIVASVLLLIRWFTFADKRECNDAFFRRGGVIHDESNDACYD